jgi:hypothetical protein
MNFYQIFVFTGQRKDAERKSKIHFESESDTNSTQIRTLTDSHRQILQGG